MWDVLIRRLPLAPVAGDTIMAFGFALIDTDLWTDDIGRISGGCRHWT